MTKLTIDERYDHDADNFIERCKIDLDRIKEGSKEILDKDNSSLSRYTENLEDTFTARELAFLISSRRHMKLLDTLEEMMK